MENATMFKVIILIFQYLHFMLTICWLLRSNLNQINAANLGVVTILAWFKFPWVQFFALFHFYRIRKFQHKQTFHLEIWSIFPAYRPMTQPFTNLKFIKHWYWYLNHTSLRAAFTKASFNDREMIAKNRKASLRPKAKQYRRQIAKSVH